LENEPGRNLKKNAPRDVFGVLKELKRGGNRKKKKKARKRAPVKNLRAKHLAKIEWETCPI